MTTVRVRLAEVPTDVLVYLAQHHCESLTVPMIAGAVAPADADDADSSVRAALNLLGEGGYVEPSKAHRWKITSSGLRAVAEASS